MKLLSLAALVAVCGAAKLDRTYLPPASAKTAGGNEGSLQTPYSANSLDGGVGLLPKGSYTNEHQGVVVDAALAGTRMTGQSGLGAPRIQYGSSDSKVGSAAFRDRPSGFQGQPQGQNPRPWNNGLGGIPYRGPQFNQQSNPQGFNQQSQTNQQNQQGFNQQSQLNQQNQQTNQNQEPEQPERPQAALDKAANTVKFESEVGSEEFKYSFETDNGIAAQEQGVDANGVQAEGAFSYTGDDGKKYEVTYTADENGYQPKGDHLPTPPPIPEEILKALEQNARDEAAGISDDGSYDEKKYNAGSEYANNGDDGKYTHQSAGDISGSNNGQNRQTFGKPGQSNNQNRPFGHNAKPGKFDNEGPSFDSGKNEQAFEKPQHSGQSSPHSRPPFGHNAKPGRFDHEKPSFNFGSPNQQSGYQYSGYQQTGNQQSGNQQSGNPQFGNPQPGYQQSSSSGSYEQTSDSYGNVQGNIGGINQASASASFGQSDSFNSKPSNFGSSSYTSSSQQSSSQQSSSGLGNINQYLPPGNDFNSPSPSLSGQPQSKPDSGSSESSQSSSSEEDSSEENTGPNKIPQQNFQDQRFPSGSQSGPAQNSNSEQKPSENYFAHSQLSQANFGFGNQNLSPFPSSQNPSQNQAAGFNAANEENFGNYQDPGFQSPFPKPGGNQGVSAQSSVQSQGFNKANQHSTGSLQAPQAPGFQSSFSQSSGNQGSFGQNPVQSQGFNLANQQNTDSHQASQFQSSFSQIGGNQGPYAQNPIQDQGNYVENQQNTGSYQTVGNQGPPQSSFSSPTPSQASFQSNYESQQFGAFPEQSSLQNGNDRFPPQSSQSGQYESQYGQSASPSTARPGTGFSASAEAHSSFGQTTPGYTTPTPGQSSSQYSSSTPSAYLAPTLGNQPIYVPGPISISLVDQYQGSQFSGSKSETGDSQSSPSTPRPSHQTNVFAQNSENQFPSSTQQPNYSQQPNFDNSYSYSHSSQGFSNQGLNSPNQGSAFPSQGSMFPVLNQGSTIFPQGQLSSFPTQQSYSSTQGSSFSSQGSFTPSQGPSFPSQGPTVPSQGSNVQGSSNNYANSQSTPLVQYSPQGPINYPNPPTIPSAAPTSSTQYQGYTVSGITQASASSFPSVSSTSSTSNDQSQFQSQGFQQVPNQYNQGSSHSGFFDQSTVAPQTIPQGFEATAQQDLNQGLSTSDGDVSNPVPTQQYEGELYEYNKPAQLPPAPENAGQPGAGQFGTTNQEPNQENDENQSTEAPEYGSQSTNQQFDSSSFSQSSFAPEETNAYPEKQSTDKVNQFGTTQDNKNTESLSTPEATPEYGENPSQSSFSTQSADQYTQVDDESQKPQQETDFSSQAQHLNSNQPAQPEIPESQEVSKAPFGLRPCCQGSKSQKPGSPRPYGFNSGFNAQNKEVRPSSNFSGQKEVFEEARKPPSFDENGYHY